jgi:hypothetical protein
MLLLPQTGSTLKQLRQALAAGLKLPDTVFLYYTGDWSVCNPGPDNPCTVPIVSHIKSWGGSRGKQTDLLVPQLKLVHSMLYHWPPRDKLPVGEHVMLLGHQQRVLSQAQGPPVCKRFVRVPVLLRVLDLTQHSDRNWVGQHAIFYFNLLLHLPG